MKILKEVEKMFEIILLILLNMFGFNLNKNEPTRLEKRVTFREKVNKWVYIHQYELLLVITILMMVTFVIVAFAVVPPMDMWNNHLQGVI